jgi:hypothetical protein
VSFFVLEFKKFPVEDEIFFGLLPFLYSLTAEDTTELFVTGYKNGSIVFRLNSKLALQLNRF